MPPILPPHGPTDPAIVGPRAEELAFRPDDLLPLVTTILDRVERLAQRLTALEQAHDDRGRAR